MRQFFAVAAKIKEGGTVRLSVFTLLFTLVAAFHTLVPIPAEAADIALFRMKRTWWGGTSTNEDPNPYLSIDYAPGLRGP